MTTDGKTSPEKKYVLCHLMGDEVKECIVVVDIETHLMVNLDLNPNIAHQAIQESTCRRLGIQP